MLKQGCNTYISIYLVPLLLVLAVPDWQGAGGPGSGTIINSLPGKAREPAPPLHRAAFSLRTRERSRQQVASGRRRAVPPPSQQNAPRLRRGLCGARPARPRRDRARQQLYAPLGLGGLCSRVFWRKSRGGGLAANSLSVILPRTAGYVRASAGGAGLDREGADADACWACTPARPDVECLGGSPVLPRWRCDAAEQEEL